jgi:hypothetical protein
MAQIMAEVKELGTRFGSFSEREAVNVEKTNQAHTRIESIEAHLKDIEATIGEDNETRARTSGGSSRCASNKHPSLKVRRSERLSMNRAEDISL